VFVAIIAGIYGLASWVEQYIPGSISVAGLVFGLLIFSVLALRPLRNLVFYPRRALGWIRSAQRATAAESRTRRIRYKDVKNKGLGSRFGTSDIAERTDAVDRAGIAASLVQSQHSGPATDPGRYVAEYS